MLYIENGEDTPLPKQYHFVNNICAHIYDQMTEILVDDRYLSLTKTEINLNSSMSTVIEAFQHDNVNALDLLFKNDLHDELSTILTKHITLSIVSDFVNFIYESLNCARKGKMTVAYALLRKPFTDELLLLEQILNDRKEFIYRFFHDGTPKSYDPGLRHVDKKAIITNAVNNLSNRFIIKDDIIYSLRYDKTCPNGINGISNRALHIVTNDQNYSTSRQNLNFVFSNQEDIDGYWDHYYNFVPYLLIYSTAVVDEIVFSLMPNQETNLNLKYRKAFKRVVAQLLFHDSDNTINLGETEAEFVLDNLFNAVCNHCGANYDLVKVDFVTFFEQNKFYCNKCKKELLNEEDIIDMAKTIVGVG